MSEAIRDPWMSKREFLRCCVVCMGGVALGASRLRALGEPGGSLYGPRGGDLQERWLKEALFTAHAQGGVKCLKCPNGCLVADGKSGKCRNRVNRGGTMYSIAYGNPCAVHIDPIEKKPFFHFLPNTHAYSIAAAGCNFRCLNCQNWQISQVSPEETENTDLMPDKVVDECARAGCESIAYTYSEPTTFYEYVADTARLARRNGIKNVLKSNGYINERPLRALCECIDAANIDLKCFDDGLYRRLSEGTLEPVLTTLKVLRQEGVWLEVTNLVIPGWTDDPDMIRRMCDWLVANGLRDVPLHFSRFTPLYKLSQLPVTPVAVLEQACATARKAGVRYVYLGNVPGHPAENTACPRCGKTVIERRGFAILRRSMKNGACAYCGEAIAGVWGTPS